MVKIQILKQTSNFEEAKKFEHDHTYHGSVAKCHETNTYASNCTSTRTCMQVQLHTNTHIHTQNNIQEHMCEVLPNVVNAIGIGMNELQVFL